MSKGQKSQPEGVLTNQGLDNLKFKINKFVTH